MSEFEFTELQYAKPVKGEPKKLYLYNAEGFHTRPVWFTSGPLDFLEPEVPLPIAWAAISRHMEQGLEVRVTDGGDMLLFHAKGGEILYPPDVELEEFWGTL
jgi:hypothetical protein